MNPEQERSPAGGFARDLDLAHTASGSLSEGLGSSDRGKPHTRGTCGVTQCLRVLLPTDLKSRGDSPNNSNVTSSPEPVCGIIGGRDPGGGRGVSLPATRVNDMGEGASNQKGIPGHDR